MSRHFLSLKLVGNATRKEAVHRDQVIQESTEWLESLDTYCRYFNVSEGQIKAIDKTYLTTSPWHKYVRHMGPSGSSKSRKVASTRGTGNFELLSSSFFLLMF
jgi:hypothetical protein